jgi:hypothetical protein
MLQRENDNDFHEVGWGWTDVWEEKEKKKVGFYTTR